MGRADREPGSPNGAGQLESCAALGSAAGSRPSALLPEEGAVHTAIAPTGLENGKKETFKAAYYVSGAFGDGACLEMGALFCYGTVDKE